MHSSNIHTSNYRNVDYGSLIGLLLRFQALSGEWGIVNQYEESWEIYKSHSQAFTEDFEYYLNFCKGYKTLELFAGYGRLANYLIMQGVDIETVEIEPKFAAYIRLPSNKNHICDVLEFSSPQKFQRIIAGFNSFCLLTSESDIQLFFIKLDEWLKKDGIASLSYYHPDYWETDPNDKFLFNHKGEDVEYIPLCDLTQRGQKKGLWIDRYKSSRFDIKFEYQTRIYENKNCILPFLKKTHLEITDVIYDYNKKLPYPGWVEFVFRKTSDIH